MSKKIFIKTNINKINKIEVTESSVNLSASTNSDGPVADADIANNQGLLFIVSTGDLKIRYKNSSGSPNTYTIGTQD